MDWEPALVILSGMTREFLAVWWLLLFSSRLPSLYNPSWVWLVLLLSLRVPFINSYLFLFEVLTMPLWGGAHLHGFLPDTSVWVKALHTVLVLGAHVAGAVTAAVTRVWLDSVYGVESTQTPPLTLSISTPMLQSLPAWAANTERLQCLRGLDAAAAEPVYNASALCIQEWQMAVFYVGEETISTLLLLVVAIHVWMLLDRSEERVGPEQPEYWQNLFKISLLLSLLNLSLTVAFPTAHQGVHTTVYLYFYQLYSPTMRLMDLAAGEWWARPLGSLVGLGIAWGYHAVIAYDPKQLQLLPRALYVLLWGFIPEPRKDLGMFKLN